MKHLAIPLTLLLLIGCGGEDSARPGVLDVSWTIGGSTCGASGVSSVRVSLFDANGLYSTENSACQLGQVTIPDVPGGNYTVQVDGFRAASDLPTYTGFVSGINVREGTVTIAPRVEMAEMPGGMDVTWRFQDGELCGFAGVDTVIINIWDTHSNRIYEESLPCNPELAVVEAEQNVPGRVLYDAARGIVIDNLYAGQYTMRAFAMKAGEDLHPKYWAEAQPIVTHSKLTDVKLTLQSCEVTNVDGSISQISICF